MSKFSKDITDDIAAENAIKAIEDAKELAAFIRGERREPLLDVAAYRLNMLKGQDPGSSGQGPETAKQGQDGPLTKETHDFKTGIEGTKDAAPSASETVSGHDIVEAIDKADEAKASALDRQAIEARAAQDKAKQDATGGPKNYVTAEDVIKKMRAEGKKI